MEDKQDFKAWLAAAVNAQSQTPDYLFAQAIGIDPGRLSRVFTGQESLTAAQLIAAFDALNVQNKGYPMELWLKDRAARDALSRRGKHKHK